MKHWDKWHTVPGDLALTSYRSIPCKRYTFLICTSDKAAGSVADGERDISGGELGVRKDNACAGGDMEVRTCKEGATPSTPSLLSPQEGGAGEAEGLRLGSMEMRFQRQGDPDWEEGSEELRPVNLSGGMGRVLQGGRS